MKILDKPTYIAERAEIRRAVVKLAVIRSLVRDMRMQRMMKDPDKCKPTYSLRIKSIVGFQLPETEGGIAGLALGDKQ